MPTAHNLCLEVEREALEGDILAMVDNQLSVDDGPLRACPRKHEPLHLGVGGLACCCRSSSMMSIVLVNRDEKGTEASVRFLQESEKRAMQRGHKGTW